MLLLSLFLTLNLFSNVASKPQPIVAVASMGYASDSLRAAATWKEMEEFHEVMAETFHPMEDGNFKPIRARAKELAEKANLWASSAVPANMTLPAKAKESLKKLAIESNTLATIVAKNAKDPVVKKSLTALHDRFHEISGQCTHK